MPYMFETQSDQDIDEESVANSHSLCSLGVMNDVTGACNFLLLSDVL